MKQRKVTHCIAVGALASLVGCNLVFPFAPRPTRDGAVDTRNGSLEGGAAEGVSDAQVPSPDSERPFQPLTRVETVAGMADDPGYRDGPAGQAQFDSPAGIAVAPGGVVYVTEEENHTIRRIEDGIVSTVAGDPSQAGGYADGNQDQALFNSPSGIAVDAQGDLIIADFMGQRIRKVQLLGGACLVSTVAGTGQQGWRDGAADQAELNAPHEVAIDQGGAIYVADFMGHRIRKIEAGMVSTVAGTGVGGFVDGPVATATLNNPAGLALDGQGGIFVADSENHSIRLIAAGTVTTVAGGDLGDLDGPALDARFKTPEDVVLGPGGRVFIAEFAGQRVRLLLAGEVSTVAGTGAGGELDGPVADAQFSGPHSIAWDAEEGAIYLTDFFGHTVRKIVP